MKKKEVITNFLSNRVVADVKTEYQNYLKTNSVELSYALFYNMYKQVNSNSPTKLVVSQPTSIPQTLQLKTINQIKFDDRILVPIKSGTILDTLVSEDEGVMPATITLAPGESGVGKTTLLLDYLGKLKTNNPDKKFLFVSAEMNEIHIFKYSKRVNFPGVEILFLGDYENPKEILEQTLELGWDVVLIDSFQDSINKIKNTTMLTEKKAESWLLRIMDKVRKGGNATEAYTAFFCTQHMTKGGDYSGSTNIKHMSDAMMMLVHDTENIGDTYVEFCKNRDGATKKKLYYQLSKAGLEYNQERFTKDEEVRELLDNEKENKKSNEVRFNEIFNNSKKIQELQNEN